MEHFRLFGCWSILVSGFDLSGDLDCRCQEHLGDFAVEHFVEIVVVGFGDFAGAAEDFVDDDDVVVASLKVAFHCFVQSDSYLQPE